MGIGILVADDEPDIVQVLTDRLTWLGHEVTAVGDGQAALTTLQSRPTDLVFLDLEMPRLSGIETLKRIRQRWPEQPVIILTAHGSIPLAVQAMKDGAVDFITKPVDFQQLDLVVKKALERNALTGEITRLLGEISHDLKNLLMPLVTGTDLLSDELNDLFKKLPELEAVRAAESHHLCDEVIGMLRNASTRIQASMKEIADYVAIARAPRRFEPCRIAKVAESVEKSLRVLLEQKQIVLRLEGLETVPSIMADENKLYSALYNLVHNAIPEVPSGGSITIRGDLDADQQSILLTVQDTGKGMPPEVRESLFTGQRVSRKAGGTGLGMKIVKDVIDLHGGQIVVDSQEGKGTTFQIRLPFQPPAALGKLGESATR
ncbi:hybrid sensor histidine kinase/response regulator [Nitrospira sp.]|nr:hybrid sensor histidine kinase/response regulator [Nitrospira sp.]